MSVAEEFHAVLTERGHDELRLGRKMVVCKKCGTKKPARGGWGIPCQTDDKRKFLGDNP